MANQILSTFIQLGLVLLIGTGAWFAWRRPEPFPAFIGLTRPPLRPVLIGLAFGLASALLLTRVPAVAALAGGRGSVAHATGGSIALILVIALFKTALSEEILFRGIIGKRLIGALGFQAGNAIQAVLFGTVHLLLLLIPDAPPLGVATIVVFSAVSGWVNGWLNERQASGSIVPGWTAHAAANLLAYSALA